MEPSKVYFTDMRARPGTSLQQKLEKLMRRAGFETIDFKDKYAAIKIHFGEPGNLSFLRPNFAKTVADMVKAQGGKPFLTDCNTLYVGRRKNALDHMDAAYENGYSPFSTGCQIIIADGLKGTDEVAVPVRGGQYIKNALIGRFLLYTSFMPVSSLSCIPAEHHRWSAQFLAVMCRTKKTAPNFPTVTLSCGAVALYHGETWPFLPI